MHTFIGGYTHCGNLSEHFGRFGLGERALKTIALVLLELAKNYWRAFWMESPEYCSMDTPQNDCHLVCEDKINNISFVEDFVSGIYDLVAPLSEKAELAGDFYLDWFATITKNDTIQTAFVREVCTMSWFPGEQLESASPIDVSFWPIHPTVERLFQYKLLIAPFNDERWAAPLSYKGKKTRYCQYYSTSDCEGHHAYDLTAFQVSVRNDTGDFELKYLTNGEILGAIQMTSYKMPYVYNDFSWPHCEYSGYSFPKATKKST